MRKIVFVLLALTMTTQVSEAKTHKHHHHHIQQVQQQTFSSLFPFFDNPQVQSFRRATKHVVSSVVSYLPHPSGCPRIAYCGCGAAVEVFGHPRRDLWLARAWYRFPRSHPTENAVAVRTHHVFVLKQHMHDDIWLVVDHNSGGHASRLHYRSIAGYTIVNPHS